MNMPKKKDVNWNNISTPELVAKQSEAYGYEQTNSVDELLELTAWIYMLGKNRKEWLK